MDLMAMRAALPQSQLPQQRMSACCLRSQACFPSKWKSQARDRALRATSVAGKSPSTEQMLIYVPAHPLVKHWVAVLRNESTPPPVFKSAMAELGRILIYEASRDWLVTMTGQVQTPCGVADVEFVDPREPIKVVPILRAGLVLVEHVASVLPATQTYHLGFVRDEETLQPTLYLNKLPEKLPENARVLVADPMLATGGTMIAAIEELIKRGIDHRLMRVVAAVAAPPALKKLSEKFPGLKVYAGIIDPELNDKGYIVPGLGDAGDRSFAT
ncbi:uracil phosphoribosyltransferase isoform X1 [Selaginella moellendorffii]|nr:uracil phosphoribosyltransferase isoform X1 [Selaginella moellendorffii]XP_024517712.1 uracil phosphoribosyltransferase isoform X1 [Selaginella moellendorffii]XP_024517713.1 uracil phosphoribosyltransferase isoform X1 [Selaginella moellendorffii]|eukprot:XP_024517710.1 uracil phosphoribosyltransferase isoform X1 [Selaginella moellendorffii]